MVKNPTHGPMRIGLVRHFEVNRPMPRGWVKADDIRRWMAEYDDATVSPRHVPLGDTVWHQCLSSDMPRALTTSQAIYPGPIRQLPELREVEINVLNTGGLKLPFPVWRWIFRLAWLAKHPSQLPARERIVKNITYVVQEFLLKQTCNTLVVSHGGVMMFLRRELLKAGFTGPRFTIAENARLYLFERPAIHTNQSGTSS